jgi:glycosyltransferase involved in cell wall biosynthesis
MTPPIDCGFGRASDGSAQEPASVVPRITVFTRSYPPAYLTGGPARSLHALVEALAAEFRFSVVTSAFDDSSAGPMQSVEPSKWTGLGKATVWYESKRRMSVRTAATLLVETDPALVYLNSLFDYRFAVLPLIIARMKARRVPVILAPRGELSAGALALKRQKKRVFTAVFRLLGLHRAVTWHASTGQEKADIERVFGQSVRTHIAINLRAGALDREGERDKSRHMPDGPAGGCLVFFSRISPKKNVAAAIQAMSLVKGDAHLSIAGPIEDARYWNRCLDLINDMRDPGIIQYVGAIPADEAVDFLNNYDLFVFPTLGENFGHVVLESLIAGTPVIVGPDTPWQRIEGSGAGWVCDPTNHEAIADLIDKFLSLGAEARKAMRAAAHDFALEVLNDPSGVDANRSMLRTLTSRRCSS